MASTAAPRLILASGSPRRAELLTRLGLEFVVRVPDVEESLEPDEPAADAAVRLARLKADRMVESGALTIACDTLVVHEGRILGKPASAADAVRMLGRLQGTEHAVYTGIAVVQPGRAETAVERTRVWFRTLAARECEEYVATGEPMDKAGAYGIQGFGAAVVERIEGDYFNVMGLPVQRLLDLLRRLGWRYAFGALRPLDAAGD